MTSVEKSGLSLILEELESINEEEEEGDLDFHNASELNMFDDFNKDCCCISKYYHISIVLTRYESDDTTDTITTTFDEISSDQQMKTEVSEAKEENRGKQNCKDKRSKHRKKNITKIKKTSKKIRKVKSGNVKESLSSQSSQDIEISRSVSKIYCEYTRGCIVWAKLTGHSNWPGMIDDDPDQKFFYWVDSYSPPAIQYHVVFFDTNNRLSRAWVTSGQLKPFTFRTAILPLQSLQSTAQIKRLKQSVIEAMGASRLTVEERLSKYGFMARLHRPGTILCDK